MNFKKSTYYRATLRNIDPTTINEEEILKKGRLSKTCHIQYGCSLWNKGFEKMLSDTATKEDLRVLLLGIEYMKLFFKENKDFLKDMVEEVYG